MDRLLPSHDPRVERVLHELKGLLLYIGKARLLKISDHVRRDPEDSSYLVDLKFARLEELCLLRRNGDRRVLHAFLQHGDLP